MWKSLLENYGNSDKRIIVATEIVEGHRKFKCLSHLPLDYKKQIETFFLTCDLILDLKWIDSYWYCNDQLFN